MQLFALLGLVLITDFLESAVGFLATTTTKKISTTPIIARRSSRSSRLHATTATPRVQIRDWNKGDGSAIYDLLLSAEEYGSFNPEGALDVDCKTESLLAESYDSEDGGCFLVAELLLGGGGDNMVDAEEESQENSNDSMMLVGTAGLIVGTPIQYQTSGSSMSSPEMTAAVRRCVVCLPAQQLPTNNAISTESIQKLLLAAIEKRAIQAKATQLIGLAYPASSSSTSRIPKGVKPTPQFMGELGYTALPQQLPGVDAVQCGKELSTRTNIQSAAAAVQSDSSTTVNSSNSNSSVLSEVALAVVLFAGLLSGGTALVGQFLGFDTSLSSLEISGSGSSSASAAINRGLGRPLSTEDLGQLLQDEQLQRTTLDGGDSNGGSIGSVSGSRSDDGREWKDLSLEERREELALLQVIQGQNVRVNK
jgi:hypothetical protein